MKPKGNKKNTCRTPGPQGADALVVAKTKKLSNRGGKKRDKHNKTEELPAKESKSSTSAGKDLPVTGKRRLDAVDGPLKGQTHGSAKNKKFKSCREAVATAPATGHTFGADKEGMLPESGVGREAVHGKEAATSKGKAIWNPTVLPSPKVLKGAHRFHGQPASLKKELLRRELIHGLQRQVDQACRSMHIRYVNKMFENWLLQSCASAPDAEPVLEGSANSPGILEAELLEGGADASKAKSAASKIGRVALEGVQKLKKLPVSADTIKVHSTDITVTGKKARLALIERQGNANALNVKELSMGSVKLRINQEHLEKLRHLHSMSGSPGIFLDAVGCLLLRYNSLQGGSCHGGGMQAALTEEALDVLHELLGVSMECFASPLNCYWPRYCSAFPDTDCPFGSLGSFFSFRPSEGSFEANPPFEAQLMQRMVDHMHALLEAASGTPPGPLDTSQQE